VHQDDGRGLVERELLQGRAGDKGKDRNSGHQKQADHKRE
jgi:hypothetical protein